MTTLLITATVFDDVTRLAYSVAHDYADYVHLGPVHQCEATEQAWWYLTEYLPETGGIPHDYRVRIGVIDRRPGTLATSRGRGVRVTADGGR